MTAEPGESFVRLEASARRALLDDEVEQAANEAAAVAMVDQTDRFQQIERFVETNGIVESNVVGAMNANYAFFQGLLQGGAFDGEMTEDQILADVWSREPEIRANTTEWVYSFLLMAYEPMTDSDMEAYIAFSETEAGERLNRAIFDAFDGLFEDVSRDLGRGAARFVVSETL